MDVARKTIELGDNDGRLALPAGLDQRGGELRASIEGVCALPRLDFSELCDEIEPLGLGEPSYSRHMSKPLVAY